MDAWRRERMVTVERAGRARNYDEVADLVEEKIRKTSGRISAKRLLPAARAAGYAGSPRNFRRLVADAKRSWRLGQARAGGRRPAVWTPGETLVIDWGVETVGGRRLHVFCAVLAWSRFRFVRFAEDEKASTTLALLAECFEVLGGVPKVVLADRMACLKGGVVANVVVPAPDYVRFAAHYRFRPDYCHAADPESKGIVENLVGYAKDDLMVPLTLEDDPWKGPGSGLARVNARAATWCAEVNAVVHSEICAIPAQRLDTERGLLAVLPSLRLEVGPEAGRQEGRQAVLHPVRLRPLLGPEPADRRHGDGAGRRTRPPVARRGAAHRRGARRARPGRTR